MTLTEWKCPVCFNVNHDSRKKFVICVECGQTYLEIPTRKCPNCGFSPKLGRKQVSVDLERLRALRSQGLTIALAARELGVSASTANRALKASRELLPKL